jgi:hypothetical protein
MLSKKILYTLRQVPKHSNRSQLIRTASVNFACGSGCGTKKKELTKFSEYQEKEVMCGMPTSISQPTLRNTKVREQYSEQFDRTPHCNGCSKEDNWERDIPLMTI